MAQVRDLMTVSRRRFEEWYRQHPSIVQFSYVNHYHKAAFIETEHKFGTLDIYGIPNENPETLRASLTVAADAAALFAMAWRCWTMIIKTLLVSP
jgi:hypothetical protein